MLAALCEVNQLFKNATRRSAPRQDGSGWQGVWEDVGRYLSGLSPPMALEFSPEQTRDPKKMIERYLERYALICPGAGCARQMLSGLFGSVKRRQMPLGLDLWFRPHS